MISLQSSKFSLSKSGIYLNCAYMSPLLKTVEKAGIEGIKRKRNPISIPPEDFFKDSEKLRAEFARLINVKEPNSVVGIPSVSYGMATVAKNISLKTGDTIVVAGEQFPSNYYSWQKLAEETGATLKVVTAPDVYENRGKLWNERILEAINKNTKLVALGNVHWADGTRFNLIEIRKRTRDVGSLLAIDGTQSVGALPFDVQAIQPDALVCAGYKWLMGGYSYGMAYFGEYFDNGKPLEENWINRHNSEDFSGLVNYQSEYQAGALRYEVGERSNFILVPMLLTALKQINQWKPENIQAYCKKITQKPIQKLKSAGFWIEDDAYRGHHLFGIRIPKEIDMAKVQANIRKNKISVSFRGDAIRVSPNVYNSEAEVNKLVKAILS